MLKLFYGCQLMLPFNNNVSGREANGTNTRLKKVNLNSDVHPMIFNICGNIPIKAVYASQVLSLKLLHTNQKIVPQTFLVKPKERYFNANVLKPRSLLVKDDEHETLKVKATQLPVISNHATTGLELQGTSVNKLFIHSWSYTMNWPYIVLSRLRTSEGLFVRKTLNANLSKYEVTQKLRTMIQQLKRKAPSLWTEQDYRDIFQL